MLISKNLNGFVMTLNHTNTHRPHNSMLPSLASLTKGKTRLRAVSQNDRRDRSSANLSLSGTDTLEDEDTRWKFYFDLGVGKWYKFISKNTFSTTFCELLPEEAQIIVDHWRNQMKYFGCVDEQGLSEFNGELIGEAKSKLGKLCLRLNEAVNKETKKSPTSKAFVKLSTRGPKDSRRVLERAAATYQESLDWMRKGDQADEADGADEIAINSNKKWQILSEEVAKASAVQDGDSALDILLDSYRVYEDLKYALKGPASLVQSCTRPSTIGNHNQESHNQDASNSEWVWNVCLVARAWDPRIRPDTEFRGICWNGKLTCLGQYFHPLFFSHLLQEKSEIQDDIITFSSRKDVQNAIESVGGNCIIDFARPAAGETIIIELNPFDGVCLGAFPASTGLFQWDNATDRKIMKGEAPFEFRVREMITPEHVFRSKFHPSWRAIIYGM